MEGATVAFIDLDQRPLQQDRAGGDLEFLRHGSKEALNNGLRLAANDTIMRAGKASIAKKGGAARKDPLVGRLNVGMSAYYRADAAIQHAREGDFFRSRFSMEIDKDVGHGGTETLKFQEDALEWIVQRRHESAALEVDNGDRWQGRRLENVTPMPRSTWGIIERPKEARLTAEQLNHLLLIPQMVAAGDHINSRSEDFLGGSRCYAGTARSIFAVSHDQIQGLLLAQFGNQFAYDTPARLANDVPDEEQFHGLTLMCGER